LISQDELAAWLRLLETPYVGRLSARRLLAAFGSPQTIFDAPPSAWQHLVETRAANALRALPEGHAERVEATWAWLHADVRHHLLVLGDANYPVALLDLPDPPLLLYVIGRVDLLNQPALAVVGSRNPSPQGREDARAFAKAFSQAGLTVISGLALGIDGAAHEGALEGPGATIAVVATGLDRVYPRSHHDLAHRIASEGALISEFSLGTPPTAIHFPMRNRLIAGLSLGTVVVEAALQSGSLITARLATEAGRDVFAMPGSIHNPQSRGCHALIKQGAKLVESTQDVLDELNFLAIKRTAPDAAKIVEITPLAAAAAAALSDDPLWVALGHDPVTLDVLQIRTGWDAARLSTHLFELEMGAQVTRLPGGLFQRLARA
jgi:DNA processing protein